MKKVTVAALSLVVGSSVAFAAAKVFSLKGESSIEVTQTENGDQIKTIETRFFDQSYVDTPKIYKVVSRSVYNTGVDGIEQRTYIEAYAKKDGKFSSQALWSLKAHGGDFQIFNDALVQVTESGCCDSPNMNRMVNTTTGKIVTVAMNESTVEFTVPNSKLTSRYMAQVEDAKAPAKRGSRTLIGSIGYFDAGRLRGVARVYANLPEGWGANLSDLAPVLRAKDEKSGHTVTLWSADGSKDAAAAYNDIGLKGTLSYEDKEESFSIVLENDRLSASRSKASSDLELEVLNY